MSNTDQIAALVKQIGELKSTDNDKRNELLDELQDAVGLAGRMVTDRDILKKADALLKGV